MAEKKLTAGEVSVLLEWVTLHCRDPLAKDVIIRLCREWFNTNGF